MSAWSKLNWLVGTYIIYIKVRVRTSDAPLIYFKSWIFNHYITWRKVKKKKKKKPDSLIVVFLLDECVWFVKH